jgi:protein involved in polysaccharide export with SLBB domain
MCKQASSKLGRWIIGLFLAAAGVFLQGCETTETWDQFAEVPGGATAPLAGSSNANANTGGATAPNNEESMEVFRVGDSLNIIFSDTPVAIAPFRERVKEDGTITLIHNKTFTVLGKTRGQLEKEIRARYVPATYVNLTVTVEQPERLYWIGGEVKRPDRYAYLPNTTVLKAIQSAGDFTDFANKKKVKVTRADGRESVIDCIKAQRNPRYDLQVLPGDRIHVPRSML